MGTFNTKREIAHVYECGIGVDCEDTGCRLMTTDDGVNPRPTFCPWSGRQVQGWNKVKLEQPQELTEQQVKDLVECIIEEMECCDCKCEDPYIDYQRGGLKNIIAKLNSFYNITENDK
jgi:hypothetical protein